MGLLQFLGAIEKQISKRQQKRRKQREIERRKIAIADALGRDAQRILDALAKKKRIHECYEREADKCARQHSIDDAKTNEKANTELAHCPFSPGWFLCAYFTARARQDGLSANTRQTH